MADRRVPWDWAAVAAVLVAVLWYGAVVVGDALLAGTAALVLAGGYAWVRLAFE